MCPIIWILELFKGIILICSLSLETPWPSAQAHGLANKLIKGCLVLQCHGSSSSSCAGGMVCGIHVGNMLAGSRSGAFLFTHKCNILQHHPRTPKTQCMAWTVFCRSAVESIPAQNTTHTLWGFQAFLFSSTNYSLIRCGKEFWAFRTRMKDIFLPLTIQRSRRSPHTVAATVNDGAQWAHSSLISEGPQSSTHLPFSTRTASVVLDGVQKDES